MNRFVRIWSLVTVLTAVAVLIYGGLTTSFRAGMADPVWPTHPFFLFLYGDKYDFDNDRAFLLEHNHRRLGFAFGAAMSILALSAWTSGPNRSSRLFGLAAILALLVCYGDLHQKMTDAYKLRIEHKPWGWPHGSIYATLIAAGVTLTASVAHLYSQQPGKWVRFLTGVLLIAVMIQGLLGGLRVFLDTELGISQTLGVELAAIHGVFGQLVFAALICVPMLCRDGGDCGRSRSRLAGSLRNLSVLLPVAVFIQLIWAAWLRHSPTPLAQRLHFITAFAVVGMAVWLTVRIYSEPDTRRRFGFFAMHLIIALVCQIILGVEAWMGKFAAQGPSGMIPPELRQVTTHSATIRTLHQLIGAAILASSVALALRIGRSGGPSLEHTDTPAESP